MPKKNVYIFLFVLCGLAVLLLITTRTGHKIETRRLADMPSERQEIAAVELNGRFYAIGGINSFLEDSYAVEVYNPQTDRWVVAQPLPSKLHHVGAVKFEDKVYVIGGFFTENKRHFIPVNSTYELNNGKWIRKNDMPTARGGLSLVAYKDKIYAIGGSNSSESLPTVEIYDPSKGEWTGATPMNFPRDHLSVIELNGRIYALGGRNAYSCYMNIQKCPLYKNYDLVETYTPEKNTWAKAKSILNPRSGMVAAVLNKKIYIFGGEHYKGIISDFEEYNPDGPNEAIKLIANLTPRHGAGIVTYGDKIYVIGGGLKTGFDPTNLTEVAIFK